VNKARGGRNRSNRGGVATGRSTPGTTPQITCAHQVWNLDEEMGRSPPVGREENCHEDVQDATHAAARQDSGWKCKKGGSKVLPVQDWTLSDQGVLGVDKESRLSAVLVVQVQEADAGAPLQELWTMEGAAEGAVEGGVQGDEERKEAVCGLGPPG